MGAYLPAVVWLIGAFICAWIAWRRGVEATLVRNLVVVILGPLAIPLVFLMKPSKHSTIQ